MSLVINEIAITPGVASTCMRYSVSNSFDIHNDDSLTALLSNGTPFNVDYERMMEICKDIVEDDPMLIHDKDKDTTRLFYYRG